MAIKPRYTGIGTNFYRASKDVADIVNLAIDLRRPILVEGEPGCGKTRLAYSIAAELGLGEVVKISVKSTSRAQDLLVRLNALRRLQDAQAVGNRRAQYVHPYLSLGTLGKAINDHRRCVVLLDEIDKADIDFPNDLLDVLDNFTFQVDELPPDEESECLRVHGFGRTVTGKTDSLPIVVVTSNREKRLPEPFLRRCLYVRIAFPNNAAALREIVLCNDPHNDLADLETALLDAMIVAFLRIRAAVDRRTDKPPTTSELLDWVRILHWTGATADRLADETCPPPHWETLFKTMADLEAASKLLQPGPAAR